MCHVVQVPDARVNQCLYSSIPALVNCEQLSFLCLVCLRPESLGVKNNGEGSNLFLLHVFCSVTLGERRLQRCLVPWSRLQVAQLSWVCSCLQVEGRLRQCLAPGFCLQVFPLPQNPLVLNGSLSAPSLGLFLLKKPICRGILSPSVAVTPTQATHPGPFPQPFEYQCML